MDEPIFDAIIENRHRINRLDEKLDRLIAYIIPEKEDKSKCTVSMRESMSCANPSNHGRIGKMPRKQPKKRCRHKGGCTNNAVEINNYCSIHQDDAYT